MHAASRSVSPSGLAICIHYVHAACPLVIHNDDEYEGIEEFTIQLITSEPFGVELPRDTSVISIFIVDPDDGQPIIFYTTYV